MSQEADKTASRAEAYADMKALLEQVLVFESKQIAGKTNPKIDPVYQCPLCGDKGLGPVLVHRQMCLFARIKETLQNAPE